MRVQCRPIKCYTGRRTSTTRKKGTLEVLVNKYFPTQDVTIDAEINSLCQLTVIRVITMNELAEIVRRGPKCKVLG